MCGYDPTTHPKIFPSICQPPNYTLFLHAVDGADVHFPFGFSQHLSIGNSMLKFLRPSCLAILILSALVTLAPSASAQKKNRPRHQLPLPSIPNSILL